MVQAVHSSGGVPYHGFMQLPSCWSYIGYSRDSPRFFPDWKVTGMSSAIAKTAYFFNCTALFQGLGNLVWMPLINKYGRRPVYMTAFTIYTITAIWCAVAKQYANFLVARIVMGIAAGAGECLAPVTIADIFFLHERGTMTA